MRFFGNKKPRKYPVKRDERGQSLRARCFKLFDEGMKPLEVEKELKMKKSTVSTYYRDWKKLGPDFDKQYAFTKGLFKKTSPDRNTTLNCLPRLLEYRKKTSSLFWPNPMG